MKLESIGLSSTPKSDMTLEVGGVFEFVAAWSEFQTLIKVYNLYRTSKFRRI